MQLPRYGSTNERITFGSQNENKNVCGVVSSWVDGESLGTGRKDASRDLARPSSHILRVLVLR